MTVPSLPPPLDGYTYFDPNEERVTGMPGAESFLEIVGDMYSFCRLYKQHISTNDFWLYRDNVTGQFIAIHKATGKRWEEYRDKVIKMKAFI